MSLTAPPTAAAEGERLAQAAVSLRQSRPDVSALDVLEVVFRGQRGASLSFDSKTTDPRHPFGRLLAEAFDWLPADEWKEWLSAAEVASASGLAMASFWTNDILPRFYLWLACR